MGQQIGWRGAFAALSACGLAAMVIVAATLPTRLPELSAGARGVAPDAPRYWLLMAMTVLAITGAFTTFTYVAPSSPTSARCRSPPSARFFSFEGSPASPSTGTR